MANKEVDGELSSRWAALHVIRLTIGLPLMAGVCLFASPEVSISAPWRIAVRLAAVPLLVAWLMLIRSFRHVAVREDGIDVWRFGAPCHIPYAMIERVRHSVLMGHCVLLKLKEGSPCGRRIRFWPVFSRKYWIGDTRPIDYLRQRVARERSGSI